MVTIKQILNQAVQLLVNTSHSARLDAEILLAYCLGKSRTYLIAHADDTLTNKQVTEFEKLIARRAQGVPIAYLIGRREFWSLPLIVTPDTLIPRPETERIVELTLELIGKVPEATILDLGTGSGAIALALAHEQPEWQIYACDMSQKALIIAKQNAAQLDIENVKFIRSDWFTAIPSTLSFHAIVANPPYIAENDPHLDTEDIRYEPQNALVSGKDGLHDINRIILDSYHRLKPGGVLLIEHGYQQKNCVTDKLKQNGYQHVQGWQDWQGNDRISGGWREK